MGCQCNHSKDPNSVNQYAAKFVCGRNESDLPLVGGAYRTSINIHNPSRCDDATLKWKVALSADSDAKEHVVSGFTAATLKPDEAMQIDCKAVATALKSAGFGAPFTEGWVVVVSEQELDIVGVYTCGAEKGVSSIHTERICARVMERCENLALDVSTGVAAWQLVAPDDDGELATLGKPDQSAENAWKNLDNAIWIYDPDQPKPGSSIFQICFDLCFGFEMPEMALQLMADNRARAELNGHLLTGTTYSANGGVWHTVQNKDFTVPATVTATPDMFVAGRNCLKITVQNDGGPSGLVVSGNLFVAGGLCPGSSLPIIPCPGVCYTAYRRTQGWVGPNCNGETIGIPDASTLGKRRMKAFTANLTNVPPGTSIEYRGVTDSGTTPWFQQGQTCGSTSTSAKLFQMEFRLKNAPPRCRLEYRVNSRKASWSPWMTSGLAGVANDRVDAFEVRIV